MEILIKKTKDCITTGHSLYSTKKNQEFEKFIIKGKMGVSALGKSPYI